MKYINYQSAQARGLVSWFPLDEAAPYEAKSERVLTKGNNPVRRSGGMLFNGTNQYVSCGGVGVGNGAFTLCCWVKATNTGTDKYFFAEGNTSSGNSINAMVLNSGKLRHFRRTDTGSVISDTSSTASINDGVWRHVAICDNLYVDGKFDKVIADTSDQTITLNTLTLGGIQRTTFGLYYPGHIRDARVYDRFLSAREIKNIAVNPQDLEWRSTVTYFVPTGVGGSSMAALSRYYRQLRNR